MKNKVYVGFDIGTNTVGYSVTNQVYDILKYKGEPAWGTSKFDEGSLNTERRGYRCNRRRVDRKKQRIVLLQQLFAEEIHKKDPDFFKRIKASALLKTEQENRDSIFSDIDYKDKDYHKAYPTIHHLIVELMNSDVEHDVRLVYLACAWLLTHRGHFLSNISVDNLDKIKNLENIYEQFLQFFDQNGYDRPWNVSYNDDLGNLLKKKVGVREKEKDLNKFFYPDSKPETEGSEQFPFSKKAIVSLLAGGTVKLADLFCKEEYSEFGSVSLGMDDEKLLEIYGNIVDDCEFIIALRKIWDWAILNDVLGEEGKTISEAKVKQYITHKEDLKQLKYLVKKYCPTKYNELFRKNGTGKYGLYAKSDKKKNDIDTFSKYVLGIIKNIEVDDEDVSIYEDMKNRLELRSFLPKQINTDNRVIPCQLYEYELRKILNNAAKYLDFLNETDGEISTKDKIVSIFTFKIPYFVGPLNSHSKYAWIQRKQEGKIYPWNFEEMVDLDMSEQKFIERMTNTCTYLPGENVLPKCSLLYQKFIVLNEINNIRVNQEKISVEIKQKMYNEIFLKYKKVTKKKIVDFLTVENIISKGEENLVTGIDMNINGTLSSHIAFERLLHGKVLTETQVERIIERSTYSEEKSRFKRWLMENYNFLSSEDITYICNLRLKDFGRLSKCFLAELEGCVCETGEVTSIIGALWNTQDNLNEIICTDRYTFKTEIEEFRKEYYSVHPKTLEERMDEMYISNAVRRPIYRTLALMKDIKKAFGTPDKIFIEMARGKSDKPQRTVSRKEQILDLYEKCDQEDVKILKKQLEDMGEYANNKLQSEKLFLYYMQLGKCMYTGKPITLEELATERYDVDHIWPQAYIKDDSILNNKVLVLSKANGKKEDKYPIKQEIRQNMHVFWSTLKDKKLITETKYKRLVRSTPFTEDEKMGFINRQFVETTQATKAVATILQEKYPETEIVYCKARLASEFRKEFEIYKSRTFNELHHAVDAYLNVVTGNVYNMKFTKRWFDVNQRYSIKTKTIFTHEVKCGDEVVWNGADMLEKVKKQAVKNNAHFVKYAFIKRGGLFDQMPVKAKEGLIPRKKELEDTAQYGGYNKSSAEFFIPVRYCVKKKFEVMIMSVELMYGKRFLVDTSFAEEYAYKRVKEITGNNVSEVSFPMGMKPWKVNTVLSLDGFLMCITGISDGGKRLSMQNIMQFSESNTWKNYIKKLERLCEKKKENDDYIFDKEYDIVNETDNLKLYDLYIEKYKKSIYSKRLNNPLDILMNGRERFMKLNIFEQAKTLLNIHETFGAGATGGTDLSYLGAGTKAGATVNFSAKINNWTNKYQTVVKCDYSPSGIWVKKSGNLLELL
ncbi:MAG: type II CRISPR RNA-guided endonuclease Cas9 [Lachnospiraceae bacterium]|nr:type II CRISPR RNA-guided endonuclease Cas9 [Lachnospiraceae bacterium]